jgi:hypothetical protein
MTQLIYTRGETVLGIWLEGWIYPRGNLDTVENRKFSAPGRKQALIPCPAYRLIAILTAIPATNIVICSFNLFSFTEEYVKSPEQ